ncbi:MAG: Rne/Rng family ribonuclease [Terriglobales bacterium]
MSKELFVSSTPHETKVGVVEDDLLAEIYLERENEYTLAGSIYKGRVTRVLPGMQSAFVDIGLERDAFLYVSDFMELAEQEEVDEIPTDRAFQEPERQSSHQREAEHVVETQSPMADSAPSHDSYSSHLADAPSAPSSNQPARDSQDKESGGGWRGRRRRRGRRGERMPDSKFARPASEPANEGGHSGGPDRSERTERMERTDHPRRSDYGPPPGYQPILLPGESISKYRGLAQSQPPSRQQSSEPYPTRSQPGPAPPPIDGAFPEDEPLFFEASTGTEKSGTEKAAVPDIPIESQPSHREEANLDIESSEWDREQKRLHELNVASVFGGATGEEKNASEDLPARATDGPEQAAAGSFHDSTSAGTIEEEEIDEEEADLADYVEDLEDDAAFEEMEEETSEAGGYQPRPTQEIAASADPLTGVSAFSASEALEAEVPEVEAASEAEHEEKEAEDAEIEEAQAEAEAILDAEARGDGTVGARAEVRAAAATAPYTQRATRPAYERSHDRGNQRGRRGGGRNFRRREQQNVPLISDLLKEGQEILVQIAKEPIGKKGARITSHIALPGRFLVYMPTVNHTGVSRKIASEEERQRLKRIILSERENGHGGFIVRTAAQGAPEEDLRADIRFLKGLWSEIKTRAENGKSPTLIYHDLNVVERVLRDQVSSDFSAIWVDTEQEYERILRFANRFQPGLVRRVKLYTKETPLYEQFGLTDEINKALKSKVWLKSGGYIVINQTEALVAIDVNTGKYVGKTQRLEDTIVKTNVDAIKEIVRQIRLRDLGGIIIIDFIDMDERRNRQKVMQALEEALRSDRAPSKVLQFNDFGLVAITRKRVKQSLERTIGSPCPYCDSTGFVKSITTVCNDIYIEMRKMAKHLDHQDVMLRVNPEVGKALKANGGRALAEMEELTRKTVIVKSDPALHQEQFDIN